MTGIVQQTPPNLIGQPNPNLFDPRSLDALLWNKGYDVTIEQAINCPCKGVTGNHRNGCKNCLGIGWVFINPISTRAIVTGINKITQYKQWSEELRGTIALSFLDKDRVSFFDKITFNNETSIMSEVRTVRENSGTRFVFCSYKPQTINQVFYFNGDNNRLERLLSSQYSISTNNPYVVIIDPSVTFESGYNGVISIDYNHDISYNIIDLPHDFRSSRNIDVDGKSQKIDLPIQAIARKAHYEIGEPTNLAGDNLLNNSTR